VSIFFLSQNETKMNQNKETNLFFAGHEEVVDGL